MIWYFIFFFVSGFCSILYEVIWLRLAMAQFGVTTAMVSIVLSAFMGGLGGGSWGSGYLIGRYGKWIKFPPLRLYAITAVPLVSILQKDRNSPALEDDRPVNEYFLIRRLSEPGYLKRIPQRLLASTGPS